MSYLIECKSLAKRFNQVNALSDINLSIGKGKIIGLLGPNGSGKTTLIKIMNGILVPDNGEILIDGKAPGIETKKIVSYLPERTYLNNWMRVSEIIHFFEGFYEDFNTEKAYDMVKRLNINPNDKLKTMSKGTKEKVQLILVMSRDANLYVLDEPIGGVDPASRDYILNTIITNYKEDATVLLSTHLISDIEMVLDEAVFIHNGHITMHSPVDQIRMEKGTSVDQYFREVFKC